MYEYWMPQSGGLREEKSPELLCMLQHAAAGRPHRVGIWASKDVVVHNCSLRHLPASEAYCPSTLIFMLPSASCRRPGTPSSFSRPLRGLRAPRHRPGAPRVAAPLRAAAGGSDDVQAEAAAAMDLLVVEATAHGLCNVSQATWDRIEKATLACRHQREAMKPAPPTREAMKPAPPPPPPPLAPRALLAGPWPPVSACVTPAAADARTGSAEAWAAAAASFASTAARHEAAAEAAETAAAKRPAAAPSAAGQEWVAAGVAWQNAFHALEEARKAGPEASAVREAEAAVQAARRFKSQRRGLLE